MRTIFGTQEWLDAHSRAFGTRPVVGEGYSGYTSCLGRLFITDIEDSTEAFKSAAKGRLMMRSAPESRWDFNPEKYGFRLCEPTLTSIVNPQKYAPTKAFRNSVARARREGVRVIDADIRIMYGLYAETMERSLLKPLPLFQVAHFNEVSRCVIAMLDGMAIAGAVLFTYDDWMFYWLGASSHAHREMCGGHILHDTIIRQAKDEGIRTYDLGGLSRSNNGIDLFKRSMGGQDTEFFQAKRSLICRYYYHGMEEAGQGQE